LKTIDLERNGLRCRSQTEAIEKPIETGITLLNRYRIYFRIAFQLVALDLPTTNNSIQRINLKFIRVMAKSTFKVLFYLIHQSA